MGDQRVFPHVKTELSCLWPASRPALLQASVPGRETPLLSTEPRWQLSLPALTSQTITLALRKGPWVVTETCCDH